VINIIAAYDNNYGIGYKNTIPWSLTPDLKRFKKLTMGNPVIMGRNTWESLPVHPLPNRENIVVCSRENYHLMTGYDYIVCSSINSAISKAKTVAMCANTDEIFIIGGARVYAEALEIGIIDKMYLTLINGEYECDTFFPKFDMDDWHIDKLENKTHNGINYSFLDLVKKE
jgi:dihydrofolate reductase